MTTWRKRKRNNSRTLKLVALGLVVMFASVALASSRLLVMDNGILGFFAGFALFLVSTISLA